eukprot:2199790-Amphidinium_carterae.1
MYLACLPVTVQAAGERVVNDDMSVWSFHTRGLRTRPHRENLGSLVRRRQPGARPGLNSVS